MREKQHPKATKNTCAVTAPDSGSELRTAATSCRNTTDGACPSTAALATYFILKGILFLLSPNKHNFWCKKPLFVSALYHFQHLWDTCTALLGSDTCAVPRDRCRCYREIPPPSKYICSRQPEPECVRCKSLSEPELVPSAAPNYSDIGAYNELETPGQGRGISPYHTWLTLSIGQD